MSVINSISKKIRRAISEGGVAQLFRVSTRYFRNLAIGKAQGINENFDKQYGLNTSGRVSTAEMNLSDECWKYGNAYEPSLESTFNKLLNELEVRHEEFIFFDVGCGKGAALIYALNFGFKSYIGIDFNAELVATAIDNTRKYKAATGNKAKISVFAQNIMETKFPNEPTVYYLYNPFKEVIFKSFLCRLTEHASITKHECYLVYYTPNCVSVLEEAEKVRFLVRNSEFVICEIGSNAYR